MTSEEFSKLSPEEQIKEFNRLIDSLSDDELDDVANFVKKYDHRTKCEKIINFIFSIDGIFIIYSILGLVSLLTFFIIKIFS